VQSLGTAAAAMNMKLFVSIKKRSLGNVDVAVVYHLYIVANGHKQRG